MSKNKIKTESRSPLATGSVSNYDNKNITQNRPDEQIFWGNF